MLRKTKELVHYTILKPNSTNNSSNSSTETLEKGVKYVQD